MRIGSRRPTRYVLVPGPVIMPGLSPSTRPTSWDTVAVFGNAGSIQLTPASLSHAEVTVLDVRACTELGRGRSEEHTSELQSRPHIVCRLLLANKHASNRHSIT